MKVAFVCTGNSCRSQMAEGFAKVLGKGVLEAYSAGTHPTSVVNSNATEVMKEAGVDITDQYPKLLDDIPGDLDILITMGCGVVCPFVPNRHKEDWGLDDPAGKSIEEFRKVRDIIKLKVEELVVKIRNNQL
jgi:arsenate reductase